MEFQTFDKAVLLKINASNLSLYSNQLHVSPSNFDNAMVGNFICDLKVLLVFLEKLLCDEMCLDGGCSTTGYKSSLQFALNSN